MAYSLAGRNSTFKVLFFNDLKEGMAVSCLLFLWQIAMVFKDFFIAG
jgi:hypothetical protein